MISEIHPLQFQNLINLWRLFLDHNMISEIYPLQFQNLTNLWRLLLDHNMIYEIHPLQFQNLRQLLALQLNHNRISEIHPQQFQNLSSLSSLYLNHNMISEIHPQQFFSTTSLANLHVNHNRISKIHPLQFQNLNELSQLNLDYNNLATIHLYQFRNLNPNLELRLRHNNISKIPSHLFPQNGTLFELVFNHNNIYEISPQVFQNLTVLYELHLEYNRISEIHPLLFQGPASIFYLQLDHNKISEIHPLLFHGLASILWLQLDHNNIAEIHPNQFQSMKSLVFLDLSYNKLVEFTITPTVNFSDLVYFSLSNNKLRVFSSSTMFQHITSFTYLNFSNNYINKINSTILNNSIAPVAVIDLRQNSLYSLNAESFSEFDHSTDVLVDDEATCCFITLVKCSATIAKSQFLTCGRLLPNTIQRVNMWILGLFALLSDLGVLFYRYRIKEKENKVQLLLICNLSISDMIMGIYMIIISSADLYYKGMFPSELWRVSFACKFAGTLSVLSSEASVFFVTLISIDRIFGIRYPFSTYRIGTKASRILSLVLWVIAISIGIVSTILSNVNPDWYDVSEVCTGLPLSRKNVYENRIDVNYKGYLLGKSLFINNTYDVVTSHQPGMYFGIAIFTALNSICFIVICVCYTGIFVTTIQTAKQAGRARDWKRNRKMATKMGTIILTDLACWAPIIILSILVQSGRQYVKPRVYTWIVTFVLPINSAINPFLYTLATVIFDFMDQKIPSTTTSSLQNV